MPRADLGRLDLGAHGVEEGRRVDALEHGRVEYLRDGEGEINKRVVWWADWIG